MDRTPDLNGSASGLLRSHRPKRLAVRGALGLACLLVAGCGGGAVDGPQVVGVEQDADDGLPVVVHVVVEASCPRLESDVYDASLLYVDGDRARVRSDCTQDGFDSVFTFDARLPASSTVLLSPSDLRGVTVDAARASAAGEITLRYEARGGGYTPVATSYGDGEDEPIRRSR